MFQKRANAPTLSDHVENLRRKRKSGRLTLTHAEGYGDFYFRDGELIDAGVDQVSGPEAVFLALTLTDVSCKFDASIQPTHRTIHQSWESLVAESLRQLNEGRLPSELFLQDDEFETAWSHLVERPTAAAKTSFAYRSAPAGWWPPTSMSPTFRALAGVAAVGALAIFTVLATVSLLAYNRRSDRAPEGAAIQIVAPGGETTTTVEAETVAAENSIAAPDASPTAGAADGGETTPPAEYRTKIRPTVRRASWAAAPPAGEPPTISTTPAVSARPAPAAIAETTAARPSAAPEPKTIMVLVQVQDGLAVKAFVPNHQEEMAAYEEAALRQARQRNYPNTGDGGWESLLIKVDQPVKQ